MRLKSKFVFAACSLVAASFAAMILERGLSVPRPSTSPLAAKIPSAAALVQQGGDAVHACTDDGGNDWYFSIGETVFRLDKEEDYTHYFPIVIDVDKHYELAPPNPNSPLGCKDNPQQLSEFDGTNWPRLEPRDYQGNIPGIIFLIEMYRYFPQYHDRGIDPPFLDMVDDVQYCQHRKIVTILKDGTFLCADREGQLNQLLNGGYNNPGYGWEFIISGNRYLTPMGYNLAVKDDSDSVETNYLLSQDTDIHYEFQIPKSASHIDPSYIIEVDKLFHSKIDKYLVENYAWPQQISTQPNK